MAFQDLLTRKGGFTSAIYINWVIILYRQNGKSSYESPCYRLRLQGESQSSKRAVQNSVRWAIQLGIGNLCVASLHVGSLLGVEVMIMTVDDT